MGYFKNSDLERQYVQEMLTKPYNLMEEMDEHLFQSILEVVELERDNVE